MGNINKRVIWGKHDRLFSKCPCSNFIEHHFTKLFTTINIKAKYLAKNYLKTKTQDNNFTLGQVLSQLPSWGEIR